MQTIYLDISNRGVIPVIYAKQNDVGRKVEVVLTNSGLPYEPEAGSAFSAWFSGASGVGNYTDIGEKSAFSVSGNKVTVELITQMLQNAGEGFLCLVLSRANGNQLGLWNIPYICEAVPGAGSEAAQQYFTAFSEAVAGLAYPDASLSVYGKAADAGATGAALAQKAPAGYGLGDVCVVQDLSSATKTGWYKGAPGYVCGVPQSYYTDFWYCSHIEAGMNNSATQRAYYNPIVYPNCEIVRTKNSDGTWSEWEWENPPMIPGVEYRTTERWNGSPVYAQLVDFVTVPANNYKSMTLYNVGDARIIDLRGYMGTSYIPRWTRNPAWGNDPTTLYAINVEGSISVTIYSESDYDEPAVVLVKYIKL